MVDSSTVPNPGQPGETETEAYIRFLEKELERSRKLEEIGMLAGVVAHDLNNMLTPIFGYSTILKRDLNKDHPLARAVGVIEKSAERASTLVSRLLGCARQYGADMAPFDPAALLDKLLDHLGGTGITIEKNYSGIPAALGDLHQLTIACEAIVSNACEAMAGSGTLSVSATTVDVDAEFCRYHPPLKPGTHICLNFSDSGHGIPAENLPRVFEPFFSSKPEGSCSGIGLTVAQYLVKRNSGCLELESSEGQGTVIRLYLPVAKLSA